MPSTYLDLLHLLPTTARPKTTAEEEVLSLAMKDSRGLRQSFELATMISPLLAVVSKREIQNLTVCSEEVLIVGPVVCAAAMSTDLRPPEFQITRQLQAFIDRFTRRSGLGCSH